MTSERQKSLLQFLLFAYIIAAGFTAVFRFPVVGLKIQPAEFIFLPMGILWFIQLWKGNIRLSKPNNLEYAFILYLIVELVSAFHVNILFSWLEVIATFYLISVYFIAKSILVYSNTSVHQLTTVFAIAGTVAALFGVSGWILSQFNIETTMAGSLSEDYPYFGHIGRAEGMLNGPNMLHNYLGLCFLWLFNYSLQAKKKTWSQILPLMIMAMGILVCFSKATLLLTIAIVYLLLQHYNFNKWVRQLAFFACLFMFLLLMTGTHFMLMKKSSSLWQHRFEQTYFDPDPLWSSDQYVVVPTSYTLLRKTAIKAGLENPVFGYGPGTHKLYVANEKKENRYPVHIINYDPHSVFLGPFAELGLPGFIAVVWIFVCLWRVLIRSTRDPTSPSYVSHTLVAIFLFMTLEGINMDILHFRHLWILFGVLSLSLHLSQHNPKPTSH